jgi:hypothetical protein
LRAFARSAIPPCGAVLDCQACLRAGAARAPSPMCSHVLPGEAATLHHRAATAAATGAHVRLRADTRSNTSTKRAVRKLLALSTSCSCYSPSLRPRSAPRQACPRLVNCLAWSSFSHASESDGLCHRMSSWGPKCALRPEMQWRQWQLRSHAAY